MDEDFIKEVHAAVADGKALTCTAMVRATGRGAVNSAQDWPGRWLSQSWLTLACKGDLSIALDASRIGNPAQEAEVLLVWSLAQNRGAIVPMQACVSKRHKTPVFVRVLATTVVPYVSADFVRYCRFPFGPRLAQLFWESTANLQPCFQNQTK